MSYAAAAAKGPKQTAEEVCLHPLLLESISQCDQPYNRAGLIENTANGEQKRAPAPPEVEHSDIASTTSLIDVDTDSVHTVPSDFSSQPIQTQTQLDRLEHEAAAAEERAKEEASAAKAKAKKEGKKVKSNLEANSDNPVYIGNAVAVVALSAGLGFGAYRKYAAGELTWKVVGAWTAVVGLFAAGDYYLSS